MRESRPVWHIRVKWVSGLLLLPALLVTVTLYSLVQVTAEGPAVEAVATAMAVSLSPGGLDDPAGIEELKATALASPDGFIKPIPGLNMSLRASELEGRTPRELRLLLFRQLAEPVYREGAKGLTALAESEQMLQSMESGVGPIAIISADTHRRLEGVLRVAVGITLVLLIPLLLFSAGFGRLLSPGVALFPVALSGTVAVQWAQTAVANLPPGLHPAAGGSTRGMVQNVAKNVFPPLLQLVERPYEILFVAATGLIALGLAGAFIRWIWLRWRGAAAVGAGAPGTQAVFPFWRADLLWAARAVFFVLLQAALPVIALAQTSAPEPSMQVLTAGMATYFTPNGLDSPEELERLREQARQSPDHTVRPRPELRLSVRERDLEGVSPREVWLRTYLPVAEDLYRRGPEAAAEWIEPPGMRRIVSDYAGYASIFTEQSHALLRTRAVLWSVAGLILLGLIAYFSTGFARLGRTGWAMVGACVPWGLVVAVATLVTSTRPNQPPTGGGDPGQIGKVIAAVMEQVLPLATRTVLIPAAAGGAMILLAVVGRINWTLKRRRASRHDNRGAATHTSPDGP